VGKADRQKCDDFFVKKAFVASTLERFLEKFIIIIIITIIIILFA